MAGKKRDASKAQEPSGEKAAAVARVLAEGKGSRISANLFLDDSVAAEDVERRMSELVAKANEVVTGKRAPVKIRRISKLAKSVALEADREMLEEICRSADVKTVLPTEIEDIYPRPVGRSGDQGRRRRK